MASAMPDLRLPLTHRTLGDFTFWISLLLRPNFGLRPNLMEVMSPIAALRLVPNYTACLAVESPGVKLVTSQVSS